ncbi:MAG: hypothetical protein ACR2JO_10200 [Mycobacteriales bacterium]
MPTRVPSLVLLLVLVCAGCGNAPPAERATMDDSARNAAKPATAQPLVLRRVGGIAGFDDRLTIAPDGVATLATRDGRRRSCPLPPDLLARTRSVAWAAVPGAREPAGRSDVMRFLVEVGSRVTALDADVPPPGQAVAVDIAAALFAAVGDCPLDP